MTGFPQRNLLTGSQVWTGDPVWDAQSSQAGFDGLSLLLNQLRNRIIALERIGELVEATIPIDSITGWVDSTAKNIGSITLTAGEWDVEGAVQFGGGPITGTQTLGSISLVSNTFGDTEKLSGFPVVPGGGADVRIPVTRCPLTLTATTTVYLVGYMGFTVGTPTAGGYIGARRVG